jgi:hypothetical protein
MWLEEMSVRELFEPRKKDDEEEENKDADESKNEITISKRELRRRSEKINNGRKDTKAKREKKKLLEKIKVIQLFI